MPGTLPLRGPFPSGGVLGAVLLVGLAFLAPVPARAQAPQLPQTPGQGQPPPRLSEEQQRRLFPEIRRLAVEDRQARIRLLQRGERCARRAADGDGLRACMREERAGLQAQRQGHREAVRALMQRNGIKPPEGGRWRGGKGTAGGGPGSMPGGMVWH